MYLKLRKDDSRRPSKLDDLIFEVQVKTFLQHAWSIATHDLVYKTNDLNWGKERIAYQIKAMLEHAEVSIQQAESISSSQLLDKQNKEVKKTKQIIRVLHKFWENEALPEDIRRLAQNVSNLLNVFELRIGTLETILKSQLGDKGERTFLNLSPYMNILQSILAYDGISANLSLKEGVTRSKVLIAEELTLPAGMDKDTCKNAIFV